jgi:hypothetical protein
MTRRAPAAHHARASRHAPTRLVGAIALVVALAIAACAPAYNPRTTYPPVGSSPRDVGATTNATKQAVIGALAAVGLQAADANRTYRPPEGPLLTAAPRSVVQVALPDDPHHGFVVIYALESPNAALAAANDHAAWVASSIGRINFAPGTRFVLRVVGANVVLFSWLPGSSPDQRIERIGPALEQLGEAITVPD